MVCGIALAALGSAATLPAQTPEDRIVITEHQITVDGRPLRYTARAGQLAIRDNETGEAHGRMFFVAYTGAATERACATADVSLECRARIQFVAGRRRFLAEATIINATSTMLPCR